MENSSDFFIITCPHRMFYYFNKLISLFNKQRIELELTLTARCTFAAPVPLPRSLQDNNQIVNTGKHTHL